MSEIIRADALRGYRELASQLGGDGEALLRASGIDPASLVDPDTYISLRHFIAALERAAASLNCPDFGMRMARDTGDETLGPISVAMRNADTARQSLEIAQRYMHFHNPSVILRVERAGSGFDFITLDLSMRRPPRATQLIERGVTLTHSALLVLSGSAYRPKEVRFAHAPIAPLAAYRAVFGETPFFEQEKNGIVVARAVLDAPQPSPNPQLRRIAEHFLASVAPPVADTDSISARARIVIAQLMRSGPATQRELAQALGLHERTLQRRLKAEHTSFEALRDDVRRELAQGFLAQPGVPLSHIAQMLGYAEASAFTRASRRWFGASPREVRRRMAG